MPENRHLRLLLRLAWAALAAAGLWLAVRVALPWLLPFLAALGLAALLEPAVGFLTRRLRMSRRWAAGVCTAGLAGVLLGGLGLLAWRLWYELALLLDRLPALLARLSGAASQLERQVYRFLIALPLPAQQTAREALQALEEQAAGLPARLSQALAALLPAAAGALPGALLFLVTTLLAVYLFSADRPRLAAWLRRILPAPWQARLGTAGAALKTALGGWLRAQLLLMLLTFGQLAVGLMLLRVEPALLVAGLIALLDALPLLGAAAVLVPWGLGALLAGQPLLGTGLLALCGLIALVRSLLEPRLIGRGAGLHPLAALMSLYLGYRALGVGGLLLAPLLAAAAKQLWDCGLLRELWPHS